MLHSIRKIRQIKRRIHLFRRLDCKQAIETAISGHFDGYHLAHDAAAEVVEMYGTERVSFVLACTIQHLKTDGRFSKETKEWADSFIIPENMGRGMDLNADYVVTSHPAVLDGFIGLARNEMREHGSEKVTGQISQETKGFSVDGHFGTWHTAEGKEIAGESFFRIWEYRGRNYCERRRKAGCGRRGAWI